jgi:RimJ/RimL family protein N-acetyltransferase
MASTWNPLRLVGRALALLREEGLGAAWRRLMRSVWVTRRYAVVVRRMDDAPKPEESPDVTFRVVSEPDIDWIARDMPQMKGHAEELLREQFEEDGDLTVIGTPAGQEGRVVFALWLSHGDFALTLLGDHRRPGDVTSRRGWVPEDYRRQGVARQGFIFTQYAARQAGIPRIWGIIKEENVASRRLHERLGYTDVGRIRLVMRFGRRFAKIRLGEEGRWRTVPVPKDRHGF